VRVSIVLLTGLAVLSCAKAKPPEDPLQGIKTSCGGAPYAPPVDAKNALEIVVENRLPKGSFGPLHACVLVDGRPLAPPGAASATGTEVANATALHLVASVAPGKHALKLVVETPGLDEWKGYAWDTSSNHEVVTEASVTSTVTVFGKNAEQTRDMVAFEWKDATTTGAPPPPPPPIATGQVLETRTDAGNDGGAR
jgi:hypothetical protein